LLFKLLYIFSVYNFVLSLLQHAGK